MITTHARRRAGASPSPGEIQARAARSLRMVQAIDETISVLTTEVDFLRLISRDLTEVESQLFDAEPESLLDPDGVVGRALEATAAIAERLHGRGETGFRAARADPSLHDDDGVAEAWAAYMDAAADLHNAAERLRERIGTLDSLLSPRSGNTYGTADELFAAMGL